MNNEVFCKLLSVDLKALTSENKEVVLRYSDFKNCEDARIEYDYCEEYDGVYGYRRSYPVLKEIKITIPCNGCSMEVINEYTKSKKASQEARYVCNIFCDIL